MHVYMLVLLFRLVSFDPTIHLTVKRQRLVLLLIFNSPHHSVPQTVSNITYIFVIVIVIFHKTHLLNN